jgi:putative salt-induced outer membrane protein
MGPFRRSLVASISALSLGLTTAEASAQDTTMPAETLKGTPATKGNTDIAKGGFVSTTRPADEDPKQSTELGVSLGGLFTSGNSRTVALTSSAKFRLRRDEHQFASAAALNFARAGKVGTPTETTVENIQGLVRYDYFLTDTVSLFLQSTARRDRFQGLQLRLNIDPGVAYYFINTKKHKLQAEVGYDNQYDIRRDDSLQPPAPADAPAGAPLPARLDKHKVLHNSRLFAGYENKLRKEVSLVMSAEYIQNYADTDVFRLIGDIGLKSNVADSLALATTYTIRYENSPLPGKEKADSIASVALVYTFF